MNINEFKDIIKSRFPEENIQETILNELYNIRGKWCLMNNEPIYIIGLSSDRWDYYYIYINKELKIKFITCLEKLELDKSLINRKINNKEINLIKETLYKYFENNKLEKLLYNIYE